ncbi:MAG TPA: PEP-CTERM sorting domain-containing protein [Roseiarcus sp.]|nr:PEP-CTERM sorting domain-containing protein [Roseiarcus sp.]
MNDTTLLVANADPSIQELTPSDFGSSSPVPEPSPWAMSLLGFSGLGCAASRARRMTAAAAA